MLSFLNFIREQSDVSSDTSTKNKQEVQSLSMITRYRSRERNDILVNQA